MPQRTAAPTLRDLQQSLSRTYGAGDVKHFEYSDLAAQTTAYTLRAVKAVRRRTTHEGHEKQVTGNLVLAFSWLVGIADRLGLDLDDVVWGKFPGVCHVCGGRPCGCPGTVVPAHSANPRPKSLDGYQKMFAGIYPAAGRTVEHAALHLAEEVGELGEAVLWYTTRHAPEDERRVASEMADYVSCSLGLWTSLDYSETFANGVATTFANVCVRCKRSPCECPFEAKLSFSLNDRW